MKCPKCGAFIRKYTFTKNNFLYDKGVLLVCSDTKHCGWEEKEIITTIGEKNHEKI